MKQEKQERKRTPIKCRKCGNQFLPKHNNMMYCSSECRLQMQKEQMMKIYYEKRALFKPEIKKCVICGKDFEQKRKDKVCCSLECAKEKRKRERKSQKDALGIDKINKLARESNLSYGQYQAMRWRERKDND
jgi:predicted nucleic acid-binding Zn ribbon protein